MKKATHIALVIVAILLILTEAYGDEPKHINILDFNGNHWVLGNYGEKMSLVAGLSIGVHFLLNRTIFNEVKFPIENYSLDNITPKQLADGLDTFYKDYRNRSIHLVNAIYVLKAEIRGEDPGYIEAQIHWLRKPPNEKLKLIREWVKKGRKGARPDTYKAKNGKVYELFWYVP